MLDGGIVIRALVRQIHPFATTATVLDVWHVFSCMSFVALAMAADINSSRRLRYGHNYAIIVANDFVTINFGVAEINVISYLINVFKNHRTNGNTGYTGFPMYWRIFIFYVGGNNDRFGSDWDNFNTILIGIEIMEK